MLKREAKSYTNRRWRNLPRRDRYAYRSPLSGWQSGHTSAAFRGLPSD